MRGISWLAAKPVSFSRRTLLHGVSKYVEGLRHILKFCKQDLEHLNGIWVTTDVIQNSVYSFFSLLNDTVLTTQVRENEYAEFIFGFPQFLQAIDVYESGRNRTASFQILSYSLFLIIQLFIAI
jgi:hypothetical protein